MSHYLNRLRLQSCLRLLDGRDRLPTGDGDPLACFGPSTSTTVVSNRTRNVFPLQVIVIPIKTAHIQIGRARASLPNQARAHSTKLCEGSPPGQAVPREKGGALSSTSTLWPACKRPNVNQSTAIHVDTAPSHTNPIADHVWCTPNVSWNQGRVVTANAKYAQHRKDSTPGSTSVAARTVNFRARSQRARLAA